MPDPEADSPKFRKEAGNDRDPHGMDQICINGCLYDRRSVFLYLRCLMISAGFGMDLFKLIAVAAFMWCTSPVSTHFMGQIEYFTNPELSSYLKLRRRREDTEET